MGVSDEAGSLSIKWLYGWNSQTVQYINNNVICFVCGNHVIFQDLENYRTDKIFSVPGTGIQQFCAHKVESLFAYSEISVKPTIFIHKYPSLDSVCELTDGAELEIKSINFSWDNHVIALSGIPDFKITIWRWTTAEKLLTIPVGKRCNPYISFNPCNWRNICTMQHGSITWWEIYYYLTNFVYVSRTVQLINPNADTTRKQQGYLNLKLPQVDIDPPDKYKIKRGLQDEHLSEPTTHCWLPNGDLLVGTREGGIWKIDGDKQNASLLWNANDKNTMQIPLLSGVQITSIAYHKTGLIIGTTQGMLLKLKVSPSPVAVLTYFKLQGNITRLQFSPNFSTLVIGCQDGSMSVWRPGQNIIPYTGLYSSTTKVIAAEMIPPWCLYIVMLLDDNSVRTVLQDSKEILAVIKMPEKCISLACSPLWYGAVLGSETGKIYVLEFSKYPNPRLIHAAAIDDGPISLIKFDESGYLMLVVISTRIYILSGRPSTNFNIFGYVDITGEILDICSWEKSNDVHFIILQKDPEKEETPGGTIFTRIQLSKHFNHHLAKTTVAVEGNFPDEFINLRHWTCTVPCTGICADQNENTFYTFIYLHKHVMKFTLPDYSKPYDGSKDYQKVHFTGYYKSIHELSDVKLTANVTNQQVISVGNDGKLVCRSSTNMESVSYLYVDQFLNPTCTCKVYLPRSGCNILVITSEGYLLCCNWLQAPVETPTITPTFIPRRRNPTQKDMPDFTKENLIARFKSAFMVAELLYPSVSESRLTVAKSSDISVDNASRRFLTSTSSRAAIEEEQSKETIAWPNLETPWIEIRRQLRIKMNQDASTGRLEQIRKGVVELGYKVAKLLVDNDLLPDGEQMPRQDFDLDVEMQVQLREENSKKIAKIRETTAQQNVVNNFKFTTIRRECWDAMKVKGAAINSFLSDVTVLNFPLRARGDEETKLFDGVILKRSIEVSSQESWIKHRQAENPRWRLSEREAEFGESQEVNPIIRQIHMGSETAAFGVDNQYLYSQFEVFTRDEKRSQIILLEDSIYKIKEKFNKLFDAVVAKKKAAFEKIEERNSRMEQIILDINLPVNLWKPEWSTEERPETCLTVQDSEIKSEKYYSPEQKLAMEKKRLEEDELRRKRLAEDFRNRAIQKMMGGVLQVRREDEIFKKDVPVPPFMLKKSLTQFNPEEKIIYLQYSQKVKELNEERDKLRKQLEAEFNRANDNVNEIANSFDDEIKTLAEQKMKATTLTFQEELKIVTLKLALVFEEEFNKQQAKLMEHLVGLKVKKATVQSKVTETQRALQGIHDDYDTVTVDERQQEKIFKRDFSDLPAVIFDPLMKLFRKRPRMQKTLVPSPCQPSGGGVENPYGDGPFGVEFTENVNRNYEIALSELDDENNCPEGFVQWSQFCGLRRTKIDLENQVKNKASIIADMMAYLQHKQAENESISKEIGETNDLILKLLQEKRVVLCNLDIQLVLKLGQVELEDECDGYLPDYGGLLLIHRSIVEDRNKYIRSVGAMKLQSMIENTKLETSIELLEWEHKSKKMTVEDLINTAKDIQQLQVTREIRDYLQSNVKDQRHAIQMAKLEQNQNLMLKLHAKRLKDTEKVIEQTEKIKKRLQAKNAYYDKRLETMNNLLTRWTLIPKPAEDSARLSAKKFDDVVRWRTLVRKALEQRIELLKLKQQMNLLLERSIPMVQGNPSIEA